MANEATFYRIIRIVGLYDKSGTNADAKIEGCNLLNSCDNSNPKELRFCVKVYAVGTQVVSAELCSIMTNFRA